MTQKIKGRIAILVANGFEEVELTEPKKALEKAGATVKIVSPEKNVVKGWQHTDWGNNFLVDIDLKNANCDDYEALILPGGVINPDTLRMNETAVNFVKEFSKKNKPIAAICHGPWTLINADIVRGYKLTSWPSIKLDLVNAGGEWIDQEVVKDRNLITSRNPNDIPAFNHAIITLLNSG